MRHENCLPAFFCFGRILGVVPYVQPKPWPPTSVVLRETLVRTPAFQSNGRNFRRAVYSQGGHIKEKIYLTSVYEGSQVEWGQVSRSQSEGCKDAMNIHGWLSSHRILSTLAARYHI